MHVSKLLLPFAASIAPDVYIVCVPRFNAVEVASER